MYHDTLSYVFRKQWQHQHVIKLPRAVPKKAIVERASNRNNFHYNDVIMSTMASQVTSLKIVYLTVYSGADQRKLQSSASLAFVRGIHRSPVNSPHKWPVTRKMFPFDDVIMISEIIPCRQFVRNFAKSRHESDGLRYREMASPLHRDRGYVCNESLKLPFCK